MSDRFVFLDRDGTLIEEVDFLSTVDETKLFDFTISALKLLQGAGFRFAVTTNQSGIARGYFGENEVRDIHTEIMRHLAPEGIGIESLQFCPHFPDAGCECRKPGIGMIENATSGFDVDLSRSWVIGDKKLDIEMGFNAGAKTALVLTGYGNIHQEDLVRKPDVVARDLLEAARAIVETDRNDSRSLEDTENGPETRN